MDILRRAVVVARAGASPRAVADDLLERVSEPGREGFAGRGGAQRALGVGVRVRGAHGAQSGAAGRREGRRARERERLAATEDGRGCV